MMEIYFHLLLLSFGVIQIVCLALTYEITYVVYLSYPYSIIEVL